MASVVGKRNVSSVKILSQSVSIAGLYRTLSVLSVLVPLLSPALSFAEGDMIAPASTLSNSSAKLLPTKAPSLFDRAWGLRGGNGIDAPAAWAKLKNLDCSKSKVTVAVIDTGIDMNHEALRNSLWTNVAELNGKPGVDDDGDKFVDDVHGWDFVKKSGQLTDSHGHGTHIAGIIGGMGGEYKGVCPGVKIMSLRYYDPNGSGEANLKNTISAIEFAVAHNVDIINYSGGGAEFAAGEYAALKKAEEKGILVVAAAGNEHNDADSIYYYPAAYPLTNIISVTAINDMGKVLTSSNFGVKKVHVAAPGQSILSTLPNGSYGVMTGTSQATAFVTGIAALLLTDNPSLKVADLKNIIEASVKRQPQLIGKTKTGGEVNAARALDLARSKLNVVPAKTLKPARDLATKRRAR